MFAIPEQFSAASKANFEAQLALLSALTAKSFESVEKVMGLNLDIARASLEESSAAAKQLLTARDPQEWMSLAAAQAQPNADKALAYGRNLANIASGVQAEFSKAAEAQIAENSRKLLELVEEASKNAPAGSENAVAMLKSAIGNANAGFDQLTKSTKQAVDTLEANLNNAVGQFSQTATKTTRATRK
jgi:phasin family protein